LVRIDVCYRGELRCEATHAPSSCTVLTDAPVDNHGRGESFSPTDLVATALGTCMLTVMGIVARRHDWDVDGTRVTVTKHMVNEPVRRIAKLEVELTGPGGLDERARTTLERAARTCPVHQTLAGAVEMPIAFRWGS